MLQPAAFRALTALVTLAGYTQTAPTVTPAKATVHFFIPRFPPSQVQSHYEHVCIVLSSHFCILTQILRTYTRVVRYTAQTAQAILHIVTALMFLHLTLKQVCISRS